MDLKAIAQSLIGPTNAPVNYGSAVNTTATNGDTMAHIQNLGGLEARGNSSSRALGALGTAADAQDTAEKAAAKARAEQQAQQAQDAQDKLKELQDPKNFKAIVNDVGGYDFEDPSGNKISAVEYAKARNMRVTDVYKGSQDPNDADFIADYNRATELGKILQSGDKNARDKFYKNNPDWQKAYAKTPYSQIVKDLHNEYPGYFRSNKELQQPQISNRNANNVGNSGGGILDRLKSIFGG